MVVLACSRSRVEKLAGSRAEERVRRWLMTVIMGEEEPKSEEGLSWFWF
jgi:hypothetical protein